MRLKTFSLQSIFKTLYYLLLLSFIGLYFYPLRVMANNEIISDGFDFPLGKPNGSGYGVECCGGLSFLEPYDYQGDGIPEFHPGEDWNNDSSGLDYGNDYNDAGDPVFAISNGVIKYANYNSASWGYLVLIEHKLPDGSLYWSQYAHLASISDKFISQVDVPILRGEELGKVGDYWHGSGNAYHLHFEIRKKFRGAADFVMNWSKEQVLEYYVNPSEFINSHRPLVSAPLNLTSKNITNTSVTLFWDKPTFENFDRYELYRSKNPNETDPEKRKSFLGEESFKNLETIEFTDAGLMPNTNYYYSLYAYNNQGFYAKSEEMTVKTLNGAINLTKDPGNQLLPKIHGRYVTWHDDRKDENNKKPPLLYIYDTEKNEVKTFNLDCFVGCSEAANFPAIYQSRVIFYALGSGLFNNTGENIYYLDVERGDYPAIKLTDEREAQFDPDIYKNIVVWQDYQYNSYAPSEKEAWLYYMDLSKGESRSPLVPANGNYQAIPKVWKDKVVYLEIEPGGKSNIGMVDINTKEITIIAENTSYAHPSIDERKVVWGQNMKTYIYDIETKSLTTLDRPNMLTPQIHQSKIIYFTQPNLNAPWYDLNATIHIYDIASREDSEVVSGLKNAPTYDYYNGILVYSANSEFDDPVSGGTDIFMMKVGG